MLVFSTALCWAPCFASKLLRSRRAGSPAPLLAHWAADASPATGMHGLPNAASLPQMREVLNAGLRLPVELPELEELRGEIKRWVAAVWYCCVALSSGSLRDVLAKQWASQVVLIKLLKVARQHAAGPVAPESGGAGRPAAQEEDL